MESFIVLLRHSANYPEETPIVHITAPDVGEAAEKLRTFLTDDLVMVGNGEVSVEEDDDEGYISFPNLVKASKLEYDNEVEDWALVLNEDEDYLFVEIQSI